MLSLSDGERGRGREGEREGERKVREGENVRGEKREKGGEAGEKEKE